MLRRLLAVAVAVAVCAPASAVASPRPSSARALTRLQIPLQTHCAVKHLRRHAHRR